MFSAGVGSEPPPGRTQQEELSQQQLPASASKFSHHPLERRPGSRVAGRRAQI